MPSRLLLERSNVLMGIKTLTIMCGWQYTPTHQELQAFIKCRNDVVVTCVTYPLFFGTLAWTGMCCFSLETKYSIWRGRVRVIR